MNCAYHGHNVAVVNCNGCGKSLCPACDHRIKGFPYCQDCIVLGVELLRNHQNPSYVPIVKANTSPLVALLLSFVCPGLGAAYNGQTTKALVYFAAFVGLIQMAVLSRGMPFFVLGFLGMWLYSAVDAWKTARLIRSGVTVEGAEDFITQRFAGNPKLWGVVLTVLGALIFLRVIFRFDFSESLKGVLSVLLIFFGIYLLRGYVFKAKKTNPDWTGYPGETGAPTFVSAVSDGGIHANDFDANSDFETQTRVRTWKSR